MTKSKDTLYTWRHPSIHSTCWQHPSLRPTPDIIQACIRPIPEVIQIYVLHLTSEYITMPYTWCYPSIRPTPGIIQVCVHITPISGRCGVYLTIVDFPVYSVTVYSHLHLVVMAWIHGYVSFLRQVLCFFLYNCVSTVNRIPLHIKVRGRLCGICICSFYSLTSQRQDHITL